MLQLLPGEYTGEVINDVSIEGCIITHTRYSQHKQNTDWHYHENLHISFVFQGANARRVNNSLYTPHDGSIFFYHAEEKHRWISPTSISKSANIEVPQNFLTNYGLIADDIKKAIFENIAAKSLILKMQQEMLLNEADMVSTTQSLLLELLSFSHHEKRKQAPTWILTLRDLLHDNWNTPLTLGEIANILGVHPVTISKYFRRYFSLTLGEYRRKLKIDKSLELIKNTHMSLSEIAFQCGFTDQSHFIRNFKQMTGFLPKDFQRL